MDKIPKQFFTTEFKEESIRLVVDGGLMLAETGRRLEVAPPRPEPSISTNQLYSATSVNRNGLDGFTLTVNGTGFVADSVIQWNGSPRTTKYVSATPLTVSIWASEIAAAVNTNK